MRGNYVSLDFAQVLGSEYDDDGHIGLSLDHYGEEEASGQAAELLCPLGIVVRPVDPDVSNDGSPEGVSPVLQMTEGDHVAAMPLNDPRVTSQLPKQKKGGFLTYCPAAPGSFFVFDGLDPEKKKRAGSFTLSAKYTSGSAKAHFFQFDIREDGKEAVSLKHGEGMGLQMMSGGLRSAVFRNAAGDAFVEVNDEGVTIAGDVTHQGALTTGSPGAADAVLKVTPMGAYFAAIEAALTSLGKPVAPFSALAELAGTTHFRSS